MPGLGRRSPVGRRWRLGTGGTSAGAPASALSTASAPRSARRRRNRQTTKPATARTPDEHRAAGAEGVGDGLVRGTGEVAAHDDGGAPQHAAERVVDEEGAVAHVGRARRAPASRHGRRRPTGRARTAEPPRRASRSRASSSRSAWRASGRVAISHGPSRRPTSKPTLSPTIAATTTTVSTAHSGTWPRLAATPPRIATVSPGTTKPKNRASSMNTRVPRRPAPRVRARRAGAPAGRSARRRATGAGAGPCPQCAPSDLGTCAAKGAGSAPAATACSTRQSMGVQCPLFDFSAEHAVTPTTTGIRASMVNRSPGRVGGGSMCSSPRSSVHTSMKTLRVVPMRSGSTPKGARASQRLAKHDGCGAPSNSG